MRKGIYVSAIFALYLGACSFMQVGDGALKVEGEVFLDGHLASGCSLELWKQGNEISRVLEIPSVFAITILISPKAEEYYFRIVCPGSREVFISSSFSVKGTSHFHSPIELGQILLSTRSSSQSTHGS
jgi:hypothetical protein